MKKFVFVCDEIGTQRITDFAIEKKWNLIGDTISKIKLEYVESELDEAKIEYASVCRMLIANEQFELHKEFCEKMIQIFVEAEYYEALAMIWKDRKFLGDLGCEAIECVKKYYYYLKMARSIAGRKFSFENHTIKEFTAKYDDVVISNKDNQLSFYKNGKKYIVNN